MKKRLFDIICALIGLFLTGWFLILCWILSSIDCRSNGIFIQKRIGRYGIPFHIFKLKTMKLQLNQRGETVHEVTPLGAFFRRYKIDEFPQFLNVLFGQMSMVGPRPDVPGYYDKLEGENRNVLKLRPGLTSEASIKYAHEEALLKTVSDPLKYNDEVLFPDKVSMNLNYYYNNSLSGDIKIILKTIFKI